MDKSESTQIQKSRKGEWTKRENTMARETMMAHLVGLQMVSVDVVVRRMTWRHASSTSSANLSYHLRIRVHGWSAVCFKISFHSYISIVLHFRVWFFFVIHFLFPSTFLLVRFIFLTFLSRHFSKEQKKKKGTARRTVAFCSHRTETYTDIKQLEWRVTSIK